MNEIKDYYLLLLKKKVENIASLSSYYMVLKRY